MTNGKPFDKQLLIKWIEGIKSGLDRNFDCTDQNTKDISDMREDYAAFKAEIREKVGRQARIWGVIGGAIPALIALATVALVIWMRSKPP